MAIYVLTLRGRPEELDALTPELWDAGCLGIEELEHEIRAYFPWKVEVPHGHWAELNERDWEREWKKGLGPVVVGQFLIQPSWLPRQPNAIGIDPGMAFGTGHHITTQQALLLLQAHALAGRRVLDLGSGSGILAIAAAKLGAREVIGIDNDPATIPIAQDNAQANGVTVTFQVGTLADAPGKFAVIIANLYAEVLAEEAEALWAHLEPTGSVIATGILVGLEPLVTDAWQRAGLSITRRERREEWAALVAAPA
ncbi:MAG: 50S ribosomal protein L11 methyltransferase [Deinococcus sp.]|nr:50S ribosomal protein L11 methyltransferase [Deinococcus sp.]